MYASKVFSEHPIASWPLDDEASYISLISENDRSFDSWELNNATYVDLLPYPDNDYPDGPFPLNTFSTLIATDSGVVCEAFSSSVINLQDLNQQMNTFAVNMYLFTIDSVEYYEFGYRYLDPYTAEWIEEIRTIESPQFGRWVRIGGTFNPPNVNAPMQLVLKVKFFGGTNPSVVMNGLSLGQWSENTNSRSLGITLEAVNQELQALLGSTVEGVKTEAYGISGNDGYILAEGGRLLGINSGIPMVYGSDNVTRLIASTQLPSLVLPSMGLLNQSGQYNSYTLEMWLRIENNHATARRIWGPVNSDYGLYVKRGFLSLVIGNSIGSYFVADWYRPMLVHIIVRENSAAVLINGEQVISITYDTSALTLPAIDEDWMGFYCHNDMPVFEVDCISVFPYIVPETVAKRRFVWGQGVESPETINSAYSGTVAYIDYPFAEYTANFTYPDRGNWEAGYFENLNATTRSISVPDYPLPQDKLGNKTYQDLYDDSRVVNDAQYPSLSAVVVSATHDSGQITYTTQSAHSFELSDRIAVSGASISAFNITSAIVDIPSSTTFVLASEASGTPTFTNGLAERKHAKFITLRPNNSWVDPAYLLFPSLNVITDVVRGIYGVFEVSEPTASVEPLMHIRNVSTEQTLKIDIQGLIVRYRLYDVNNNLQNTFATFTAEADQHFTVGFHLPLLFEKWGTVVGEFFGNPSSLQIYIGGDGVSTFSGSIYRIGFSNQTNLDEIDQHFHQAGDSKGLAIMEDGALLHDHIGSYTLLPIEEYGRFYLDIGVSSYWEEYYPLSVFAGYVQDKDGNLFYDVDFLQYNIGYPTTTTVVEDTITGSWTYDQLNAEYNNPISKTYEVLDNFLVTGYDNYIQLSNKEETLVDYNFDKSSVRSYITFQRISDGANKSLKDYQISQAIPSSRVLDVPTYDNIFSTKFEIKDQSVIYPPKTLDISETAAVIHLDIKVEGIRTNPLNIRKMSLISKAFQENDFSTIGTRFGSKLYPYTKNGLYYDYKQKNPYAITKDSSPYLYLTKYSGIEPLGQREFDVERGISLPINERQAANQKVSAIQLWIKYSEDDFPNVANTLFSLNAQNIDIGFQIISDQSGSRGRLTAINLATKLDYTSLTFYQDGVPVLTPFLEKDRWTVIGINFAEPINYSNYNGAINLFPSAVFNNVAYYNSTSLQEALSIIYRRWNNVDGTPALPYFWEYWKNVSAPTNKWDNVLKIAESGIYGVSPETLFKSYTGTNRQVVDDNTQLTINSDGTLVFVGAEWSTYTQKPV